MRLLVKSRKKYHRSIMKCHRSIIKDSTMHEKNQFRHRKKLVLTSQSIKRILPKNKLAIWAFIAHSMGTRCPTYGLPMPALRATDAHVPG